MNKIRLCYSQGEEVKYISHLDFLRTMTRILRRADLPMRYSEGFNPHMVMTIGLPLSVGTTSVCDCLDMELTEEIPEDEIKKRLNEVSPKGIVFKEVKKAEGLKPLYMIDSALYEASFKTESEIDLEKYIAEKEVLIEKKSKRKINEVNIKDFIRNIEVTTSKDNCHTLLMHINAGNFSNLKPELVVKSISAYFNCKISDLKIERKEIYFDDMTRVF